MESLLRKGESGLRQDELVLGAEYSLYREKEFIGVATYIDYAEHGLGFFSSNKETKVITVFAADEWLKHLSLEDMKETDDFPISGTMNWEANKNVVPEVMLESPFSELKVTSDDDDKLIESEILYGFCGWLTTQDFITKMGATENCSSIPDLIVRFSEANNLKEPRQNWAKYLTHPKEISNTCAGDIKITAEDREQFELCKKGLIPRNQLSDGAYILFNEWMEDDESKDCPDLCIEGMKPIESKYLIKSKTLGRFHFELDLNFWNLLPAFNINLHSKNLEFEFLCFGAYIRYNRDEKENNRI